MPAEMDALRAAKRQLRKNVQRTLKSLSESDIAKQSTSIHERLFALPEYQAARNISIYLSMPTGEVSTGPIVKDALKRGKKVFVPFTYKNKYTAPGSLMDMVALHSESDYDRLQADKWGIPTPDEASIEKRARCLCTNFALSSDADISAHEDDEAPLEKLDLVVTPGVAFDRRRQRLGHGKGFYDIFFSQYEERIKHLVSGTAEMPYLVGIALNEQVLPVGEEVPTDASDRTLDAILAGDMSLL